MIGGSDEDEIVQKLSEEAGRICADVITRVRKTHEPLQQTLAILIIGRLFGTAYSATVAREGPEAAMDWASNVLLSAESIAQQCGEEIHFMVARKDA